MKRGWLHGPPFISRGELGEFGEPVPIGLVLEAEDTSNEKDQVALVERFSSLDRAIAVMAWVMRPFVNFKRRKEGLDGVRGALQPEERDMARDMMIRQEQKKYLLEYEALQKGEELSRSSPLLPLHPFWDNNRKLILMKPRTQEESMIVLPRRSWFTRLVIRDRHEKIFHLGAHATLAQVRREFWIPHGLSVTKTVLRECRPCRRIFGAAYHKPEGPLPHFRTSMAPPFSVIGTDLTGPLHLEDGRKAWILLMVCAVTRSVHFELCTSCAVDELQLKFRKFFALRTIPFQAVRVFSDNAASFRKLAKMKFPQTVVKWSFSPPYAPYYGGFWEKIFDITKRCLRVTCRQKIHSFETLTTILAELASAINGRPLTPLSPDADEIRPLTPNDFLFPSLPPDSTIEIFEGGSVAYRKRFALQQRLAQRLWRVWTQHYLSTLRAWRKRGRGGSYGQAAEGDVVLMQSPVAPRARWALGRVIKIHPSSDGKARVVTVLSGGKERVRAVASLCPLESGMQEGGEGESKGDQIRIADVPSSPLLMEKDEEKRGSEVQTSVAETRVTKRGRVIRAPQRFRD